MKTVVVCYKWVVDESSIRVDAAGRLEIDASRCKINDYDKNGIETGVFLKKKTGARLVGITCGVSCSASVKDALSRGLDEVIYLEDPSLNTADAGSTAKNLASLIRTIPDADVIICSEGSSDEYAQQTGPRLAILLGMISVSGVNALEVRNDTLVLTRKLDDCMETVEAEGRIVISVSPDINEAPIPGVKAILGAKRKPVTCAVGPEYTPPQLETVSLLAPVNKRKQLNLTGDGISAGEAALKLIECLKAEGVLA